MSDLAPEPVAPEAPEAEAPEAPAESAWAGPSSEEWQETQEALQYLASLAQPQSPFQQPQPEQPLPLDPLEDDFEQRLNQWAENKFAPYAEYVQMQQMREGSARAEDILADDIARNGEFIFNDPKSETGDSKQKARALADSYIGEMNQQYPNDPRHAAEAALAKAAQDVRDWETNVRQAAIEQYKNELAGLGGARRELGAGINGQQFSMPTGGSLVDVAYRHGGGR